MRPPTPTHPDHGAASWLRPTRLQIERFPRVCTEGESNWMLRRAPLPANAASPVRFCRSGMSAIEFHENRCRITAGEVAGAFNDDAETLRTRSISVLVIYRRPRRALPASVFAGTYLDFVLQLNFKERVGLMATIEVVSHGKRKTLSDFPLLVLCIRWK